MTLMRILVCLACLIPGGCAAHLLSGMPDVDRSRPVAVIDMVGEASTLGATTEDGILFLRESGAKGPCRVHYFLGEDLLTDDGEIEPMGEVFSRARIDLKTQAVPVLRRELTPQDSLVALVLADRGVRRVDVQLSQHPAVAGAALEWPGRDLPRGAAIFTYGTGPTAGDLIFVGLTSGLATLQVEGTQTRFITFAGPARLREAMALAKPLFHKREVIHRPDGISISR